MSRQGLELIKSFEGFRPRAERLDDGRWIIGHGHALSAREGAVVTPAEAELLLQYDLLPILKAIEIRVKRPLNPHQVDALASFGLSVGMERFLASSLLGKVDAGQLEDAALDLTVSDAPLAAPAPDFAARRRAAEGALFRQNPETQANLAALLAVPIGVLASEPKVAEEPSVPEPAEPGAQVSGAAMQEASPQEPPLFIEDPAARLGGQPVFMPEGFEVDRGRRFNWGDTGAFLGMGVIGVAAFGAAVLGLRLASTGAGSSGAGDDHTTLAAGVLVVVGVLCMGVSAYSLYRRWGRRGDD